MLQNPHYHSHAEQQAALGCAAVLDPIKHPRRYAKQQAREKFKPLKRNNQPGSPKTPPDILAKAKALTHLHITEAARQLGVSRSVLERLRCDYGLAFSAPTYGKAAERLMALAGDTSLPLADRVRALVDAFAQQGITEKHLRAYLNKSLDEILPEEIATLRGVYNSIKNGQDGVADFFSVKATEGQSAELNQALNSAAKAEPA